LATLQVPSLSPTDALLGLQLSGESFTPDTLARAKEVLDILKQLKAPAPFVFPTEIAGVQFEWKGGGRELDIELRPEEPGIFFVTFEHGRSVKEAATPISESALRDLLGWLG